MSKYRVHIYADGGHGRWLDSKDFAKRPGQEAVNAAFEQLQGPGWFEVKLSRLSGDDELALSGWTQENGTPGRKS